MKCPDCGARLKGIPPLSKEEWLCDNPECPAFYFIHQEYYGTTQAEINKQRKARKEAEKV